jgi:hypothetical protein
MGRKLDQDFYEHEPDGWKARIVGKFRAFHIYMAKPYVGLKGSVNNLVLTP